MAGEMDAAATITAAVINKMSFPPDADVVREAVVIFRKVNRALAGIDGKSEAISERKKRRRDDTSTDPQMDRAARLARKEARGAGEMGS